MESKRLEELKESIIDVMYEIFSELNLDADVIIEQLESALDNPNHPLYDLFVLLIEIMEA